MHIKLPAKTDIKMQHWFKISMVEHEYDVNQETRSNHIESKFMIVF